MKTKKSREKTLDGVINILYHIGKNTPSNTYIPFNDVFFIENKDGQVVKFSKYFGVSIEKDYLIPYVKAGILTSRTNANGDIEIKLCSSILDVSVLALSKHYTKVLNEHIRTRPKRVKKVKTSIVNPPVVEASTVEATDALNTPAIDTTGLIYSIPRPSTLTKRLKLLNVLAYNSRNGYVSKKEAFITPMGENLAPVNLLDTMKLDAEFLPYLYSTEYVDVNEKDEIKWVYKTPPTPEITYTVSLGTNIKKASYPSSKKKNIPEPAKDDTNTSIEEPIVNDGVSEEVPSVVDEKITQVNPFEKEIVLNNNYMQMPIEELAELNLNVLTDRELTSLNAKLNIRVLMCLEKVLVYQEKDSKISLSMLQLAEKNSKKE